MNKIVINDKNGTKEFAKKFLKKVKASDVICLIGDLGAGKTFFVKCIADELKVKDDVTSPTFNILKIYKTNINKKSSYDINIKSINHYDVYRIKNKEELVDIGFFDNVYEEKSISIIEWADLIKDSIPKNAIWINIKLIDKEKREITIS